MGRIIGSVPNLPAKESLLLMPDELFRWAVVRHYDILHMGSSLN